MSELSIIKYDGDAYIDSREVAELIGKRHDNLLRDINGYLKTIEKSNVLKIEGVNFFIDGFYLDSKGERRPCYLLTKMGCEMVANKLTGEKGVVFTFAYVSKFNAMEQQERERQVAEQNKPRLSEFNSAVRNVLGGMSYTCASPQRVMNFLHGVYSPLGIEVAADGDEYGYYSATDIARNLGVYSDTGRPHGHAVAAIISKLNISAGHIVVVPYGLVSVFVKYDAAVVNAVFEWLAQNGFPYDIPHGGFEYHVYYDQNRVPKSQMSLFDGDYNDGFNDDDLFYDPDEYDAPNDWNFSK